MKRQKSVRIPLVVDKVRQLGMEVSHQRCKQTKRHCVSSCRLHQTDGEDATQRQALKLQLLSLADKRQEEQDKLDEEMWAEWHDVRNIPHTFKS